MTIIMIDGDGDGDDDNDDDVENDKDDDNYDDGDDDDNDDGKSGGCEGWLGAAIDSQDGVMCHGRAASTKIYTPPFQTKFTT